MRYAFLIYGNPNEPDSPELMAKYGAFSEEVAKRGAMRGGERLQRANEAVTVHVRAGKMVATDGPYAETKEQLGGFFILECKDKDEAIEFAAKIPTAMNGYVEARPIWEMG